MLKRGEKIFDKVSAERKPHLARLISESYLVLGDAGEARKYYEYNLSDDAVKSRSDWFYSGSVLYAVQDYKGAVDSYEMMVILLPPVFSFFTPICLSILLYGQ